MSLLQNHLSKFKPHSEIIANVDSYNKKGGFGQWWTRNVSNRDILKQVESVETYKGLADRINQFESKTQKTLAKEVSRINDATCDNSLWINNIKQKIAESEYNRESAIQNLNKFYGLAELNSFQKTEEKYICTPFAKINKAVESYVNTLEFLSKETKALLITELVNKHKESIVKSRDSLKKEFLESDEDLRNFREKYQKSQEEQQQKTDKVNTKEPYQQHADV